MLKKDVPLSYFVSLIKFEMAISVLVAAAVLAAHVLLDDHPVPIPVVVVAVLVTAVTIILMLRATEAQKRWTQANSIWGDIVAASRTFARQIMHLHESWTTGRDTAYEDFRRRCIKRHIAWCYTLAAQLRGSGPMHDSAEYLDKSEIKYLDNHSNKAAGLLVLQADALSTAHGQRWLNSYQQVSIDETLRRLTSYQSACESMKNTVLPGGQALFTNFLLYLLLLLLPVSLVEHMGISGAIAAILMIAVFFLVDKITTAMLQPFDQLETDVPMTQLTRAIESDIYQTLGESFDAKPTKSDDYYLM